MVELSAVQHNQRLRIPALWSKLLRRLMALPDGEYYLRLDVASGRITWRFLVLGKTEGAEQL